ncbi:MAG: cob(I)yrinic acid a,c-diamide adenosyltransferase [Minisyncoccia bacterium]
MFYTKKGDDGKTQVFGCDQRLSKSSAVAEALGVLDEGNSFLGICKIKLFKEDIDVFGEKESLLIEEIQNNLFTIQAQIASVDKKVLYKEVEKIENLIIKIETVIPPVKSFIVSGSCEISALFDFARALIRTAERRVVAVSEEGLVKIDENSLKYLNRLSSFLFALARHNAYKSGINEGSPIYK